MFEDISLWYKGLTVITTVIVWLAFLLMIYGMTVRTKRPTAVAGLLWIMHCTIFWTALSLSRCLDAYVGPSNAYTIWANVIFLQAFITYAGIGLLHLHRHHKAPRDAK